jgi:hypothetical protein
LVLEGCYKYGLAKYWLEGLLFASYDRNKEGR